MSRTEKQPITPIKSPTDDRHYQVIELSNGLQCICIEDPDADQAAAALSIHAGHFDDPTDAQGLAHFLEHMLFLGTKGYPEANSYQQFMSTHGGHHNAWTGTEYTCFYYSIDAKALPESLDRFSRFFYEPLFSEQWIEKERQAVDAEFKLKQTDELRRLYQVQKCTANPAHPFTKFSVGNAETLADQPDAPVVDKLTTFFARHYHAQNMRLVVAGPQPVAELAALAEQYFALVPATGEPKTPLTDPLYLPEQQGVWLLVKPIKEARRLIVTFPLPAIDHDYAHKTTSFIAHILGYEGPMSLFSALRQRGWINSLSAGGGMSGANFKDFTINLQLTNAGLGQVENILRWIFAYIKLIAERGLEVWRYQERKQLVDMNFHFQESVRTAELVSQLAINAQHYPPEDVIFGDYRMNGLKVDWAQQLLSYMTPACARITLIHRAVETDSVTRLYDTPYSIRPLSKADIAQLQQAPDDFSAQLPVSNPYLLQDFEPALFSGPAAQQPTCYPIGEQLRLWHLQDPDFRQPKGHIYLLIKAPLAVKDVTAFAAARLWCELLLDELNEDCYDADVAGLHFHLYPQQRGFTLHIHGFSRNQVKLMAQICEHFQRPVLNPQRFGALQNKLVNNWRSAHTHKPINKLFAVLNAYLQPHTYMMDDLAHALETLDFATFEQASKTWFTPMNAELLVHGDLPKSVVHSLADVLEESFQLSQQPVVEQDLAVRQLERVADGMLPKPTSTETQHQDSAVLWFVQGHATSVQEQAGFMLLNQFIAPEIFNQLRTEQQLGYLVGSNYLPMQQQPGILMYVQSPTATVQQLRECIVRFRDDFLKQLSMQVERDWDGIRQGLLRQLRAQDPNLRLRSQRLWSSITQHDIDFTRLAEIATALEQWRANDFLEFAMNRLYQNCAQAWFQATPLHSQR